MKFDPPSSPSLRWDIFCRVIDNHGDLGVCWRLCADLAQRGHTVRLWVDDASALAWMAPQGCTGVAVHVWPTSNNDYPDCADVVIEAFGCELPEHVQSTIAAKQSPPVVWINLEYLSAEDFVERCHGLPSPVMSGPAKGCTKWFFYPGFTPATGGLLCEPDFWSAKLSSTPMIGWQNWACHCAKMQGACLCFATSLRCSAHGCNSSQTYLTPSICS